MKKAIFFLLAALFLFINCLPSSIIFADDSGYTSSQYADIGTIMLTSLIQSGEATELDFSDYTESSGLDFLISLGELAVTGDPTGLIEQGLDWLSGELSDTYESLIWDIREWEHSIAPNLYDLWYNGGKYQIDYLSTPDNISRPLTNLLRNPNSTPTPSPSPDFSFISNINNLYYRYNLPQIYDYQIYKVRSYSSDNYNDIPNSSTTALRNFTIIGDNLSTNHTDTSGMNSSIKCSLYNNIITINVYTDNGIRVVYSSSSLVNSYPFYRNSYDLTNVRVSGVYYPCFLYYSNSDNIINYNQSSFDGLSTCINYIYNHYANVNLYVDGVLWAMVGDGPTYPIVIPNMLTVLNNQPAKYTFSEPTYLDLTNLKTLITNAINSSDVLTWQDIDDYFLDINGQQAFPVVKIVRNDYDQLYLEQYPYPAKLIGMQEPLTFNENMLNNYYGQYLTPMVNVVSNTVDVIPGELKWVLGIGAILMIFAVIINRLLE